MQLLWPVLVQRLPIEREHRFECAWPGPEDRKIGSDPAGGLERGLAAAESFASVLHALAEFVPAEPEASGRRRGEKQDHTKPGQGVPPGHGEYQDRRRHHHVADRDQSTPSTQGDDRTRGHHQYGREQQRTRGPVAGFG